MFVIGWKDERKLVEMTQAKFESLRVELKGVVPPTERVALWYNGHKAKMGYCYYGETAQECCDKANRHLVEQVAELRAKIQTLEARMVKAE